MAIKTHEPTIGAVDLVVPYVPRLLIDWLRDTPDLRYRSVEGTLAFVDISGFTKMTERLARKGKVGAEEMSDTLNRCFSELLSVAYDYGAGLVKWGGDAVLLLFEGEDHAKRACRGAFEMQRAIRTVGRLKTTAGSVTLRMSVGIHSGAFDFFLVGDLHRELVISGPAATECVTMEQIAEAGEIAISETTASLLDPAVLGARKDAAVLLRRAPDVDMLRAAPVGAVDPDAIAACLPILIRDHVLREPGEAEHRFISVAFVEFSGVQQLLAEEGVDALTDALEECMSVAQRETARYSVSFHETDINKDGGKIMLVAGAPTTFGEDQERMLRAVRGIMDAGTRLPLRIGVNAGRVFSGDFGPPFRRTFSVKGDAINLAARVMGKAATGEILATKDVLAGSAAKFATEDLEPFLVKGKGQPVNAARVGGLVEADDAGPHTAPLVGRESELEVLRESLQGARDWEGWTVDLVGEPGVGKSRLLDELRSHADDVLVLGAVCAEYEVSTPYFPFRNLLWRLLALDTTVGPEDAADRLTAQMDGIAPQLVPWLPLIATVLDLEVPPTPETESLDEKFRKARLEEVVRELLGTTLLTPTLLVFEDVHWLDDASHELLAALVEGIEHRPWLIVATRREHGGQLRAVDRARVRTIELGPLDEAAAAALLEAETETLHLPPHQIAVLQARAGGNPFFLQQLVAAAREAGSVDALPDSIEGLVGSRIDRLAPADKSLLRYASVLGLRFERDLLGAALPDDATRPDDATWARLDALVEPDGRTALRFKHALIRDAAYEGLPYRRRRDLHGRVGATIERRTGVPDDAAELLSLHFFDAHEFQKAWRYSLVAGGRASSMYANAEAAVFYERAITAARGMPELPPHEVAEASEKLGDVRVRLGEFVRAGAAYRASRSVATDGAVEEARLLLKEAMVPWRLGKYPQTVRWLRRAERTLDGATEKEARALRARIYAWLGGLRIREGNAVEAIRWCERAIEEATNAGSAADEPLAHAYQVLDSVYAALGRFDQVVHSRRALAIYEEHGNLGEAALMLNNLGVFEALEGRWTEAADYFRRAEEAWERAGDRFMGTTATMNRGEILTDQGRFDEAAPLFRSALRVARASHATELVGAIASVYGRFAAHSGRFEEAHELLGEALEASDRVGARDQLVTTNARFAECLVLEGEAERARTLAVETLAAVRAQHAIDQLVPMLKRIEGSALMQLGEFDAAAQALEQSVRDARAEKAVYELSLALDALALLRTLRNEPADELVAERDVILGRLDVVSVPSIPLPERASA